MELWIGHIRLKVEFPQLFSFTGKTSASIAWYKTDHARR